MAHLLRLPRQNLGEVNRPVHRKRLRTQIYRSSRRLSIKSRNTSRGKPKLGAISIITGTYNVSSLSYFNYNNYFKCLLKKKNLIFKMLLFLLDMPYFIFDEFLLEMTKIHLCSLTPKYVEMSWYVLKIIFNINFKS